MIRYNVTGFTIYLHPTADTKATKGKGLYMTYLRKRSGETKMYSSNELQRRHSKGVDGRQHTPTALPLEKIPYQFYRKPGGSWANSGWAWKNLVPIGILSADRLAGSQSLYCLRYPGIHQSEYGTQYVKERLWKV